MIETLLANVHWAGAVASVAAGASSFIGGVQKYALIAAAITIAGLSVAIYAEHEMRLVDLATIKARDAKVEELQVAADRAGKDIEACKLVNANDVTTIGKVRADAALAIAAAYAEMERIKKEAASQPALKVKIDAAQKACPSGTPLAYRAVDDWLRDNPDPGSASAAGRNSAR